MFDIDLLGQYLLFDDADAPLAWGFLGTRRGLGRYVPGKATVGGDTLFYSGTSQRMRVLADFSPAPAGALAQSERPDDPTARALERLHAEQRQFAARRRARWQASLLDESRRN